MNHQHQELLEQVKKYSKTKLGVLMTAAYSGSSHQRHGLTSPEIDQVVKLWVAAHRELTFVEFLSLVDSLLRAESIDEKKIGSGFLRSYPNLRIQIKLEVLETWLTYLEGWEEVDSVCQSMFTANELLTQWELWQKLLQGLAASSHPSQRRASLVLLVGPVGHSDDKRLASQAFANIESLKNDRSILITKAISWLLRSLINMHRSEVETHLEMNLETLPKIAIRETKNKLRTGRK